jgi:hypothetical protein
VRWEKVDNVGRYNGGWKLVDSDGVRRVMFFRSHERHDCWYVSQEGKTPHFRKLDEWPEEKLKSVLLVEARLEGIK